MVDSVHRDESVAAPSRWLGDGPDACPSLTSVESDILHRDIEPRGSRRGSALISRELKWSGLTSAAMRRRGERAFSLIELLVVVTLLAVIVLGLMAVFNQTQRAFRTGMSQVDVLESGRATMDIITREVAEMSAMTGRGTNTVNFFVRTQPEARDLVQELPGLDSFGAAQYRTNILQEFFFVSRVNQEWIGTGYTVHDARNGIGTLYRYQTKLHVRDVAVLSDPAGMLGEFLFQRDDIPNTNRLTRVADGVIHFQVNAYRTNGFLAAPYDEFGLPWGRANVFATNYPSKQGLFYEFYNDALPTAVEIELAVVEPDVLERVEALPSVRPDEDIRRNHLKQQTGKVHVFKQRVPIRRVNTDAYK